jgi:hypothetical protein
MQAFNTKEQAAHRKAFIDECLQKAWGAACHAGFIEKNLNESIAAYQKLQAEDKKLDEEINTYADALDQHTVANRNKRAELQKTRTNIANEMKLIARNTQQGAESMQKLLTSKEQNLLLAEHAKDWSWVEKEKPTVSEEPNETSETHCVEKKCKGPKPHDAHPKDIFKYDDFDGVPIGA